MACLLIASFAGMLASASAADSTWDGDTDGTWSTVANWTTGALPNNSNAFFINSTLFNTINVVTAVPIFNLNFSGATLANYTFGGALFSASGSGSSVSVAATVINGATVTFNNNTQSTTTNRTSPGGYSVSTASGSNSNLIFNGNMFASIGTAGITSIIDFRLSNAAISGSTVVNGIIMDSGLGKTGVSKTGGGQGVLTLNGANTYSGQTVWNTDSGSFVLGNKAALSTGAIRVAGTSTASSISASTSLIGADAITNVVNALGSSFNNTTNLVLSVVTGTNTGTIVSGTAPKVGDMVTGGVTTFLPASTRITDVSGTTVGSTVTFDLNAAATGNTAALTTGPTATNNAIVSVTVGSPTGSLVSGVVPNAGDLVSAGGGAHIPLYTRVLSVAGSGPGAVITFDTNATTTGNTAALTTVAYANSSTGILSVGGTHPIEFSGTQNLSTVYSNGAAATRTYQITNTADTTFSGVLQELTGVASLTKTGVGKLILTNANTYSGNTTITAGALQLGNGGATGSLATTGNFTANGNLTINRSNIVVQGTDFSTAAITGTGTLTHAGTGTLILTAANSFTGGTTITAGILQIGNNGATGSLSNTGIILNNGTLYFKRSTGINTSATITGTGSLIHDNQAFNYSNLTVSAANSSYSGTTTIKNGFLNVGANSILSGADGPLGNTTSAIILGDPSTLLSGYGGFGPNAVLQVGGINNALVQNYTISRDVNSSTSSNLGGRNNIQYLNNNVGAQGTLTISGAWALPGGSARSAGLAAQQAGMSVDFTGVISGGSSANRFRINDYGQGVGKIRLSNAGNTYGGQNSVTNGTLLIGGNAAAATGVLGTNATVNLAEGGNAAADNAALIDGAFTVDKLFLLQDGTTTTSTWTLGGNQPAVSSFTGTVTTVANANSRTLQLSQVAGGAVSFSGVIGANTHATATTSIDKIGLGTVNLTVANTYDGNTTVTDGTLSMSAPAMADTSTLKIGTVASSPAILNLPNAGTDTVSALIIDGVLQANGLYDSSNSGGAITGVGKIQVAAGVVDDYTAWIDTFPSIIGANRLSTADADGDGLTNQTEYAFGLIPNSGSSVTPITVQLNKTTGKFTYTRRTLGLPDPDLGYAIQTSINLSGWTLDATAAQVVVGTVGQVQTVEVTLSATAPLTAPVLFVRVVAQ